MFEWFFFIVRITIVIDAIHALRLAAFRFGF